MAGQPLGKRAEAVRQPGIVGQIGDDPGTAHETGLGGDKQESGFGHQGDDHEDRAEAETLEEDGVQRLARLGRDAQKQVDEQDAAGRERQGKGHVEHGAFGGRDLGVAHQLDAVRNRFNAGVGAGTAGVSAGQDTEQADYPDRGGAVTEAVANAHDHDRHVLPVKNEGAENRRGVGHEEQDEYRRQNDDGLLGTPQVQDNERDY